MLMQPKRGLYMPRVVSWREVLGKNINRCHCLLACDVKRWSL